jgi:ataxia telangiectasia mutated family protein
MELLQDKVSGRNLLGTPAADLVFSLLCETFQRPNSFRDDILGEDPIAVANAVVVWDSVQNQSHGQGYRLWAARALGRAYAATGLINDSLLREQRSAFSHIVESSSSTSKVAILHMLCDSLFSNNQDIGLAERTLQVIANKLSGHSEVEECETAIPTSLMKALVWAPYQCPDLSLSSAEASSFNNIYWAPTISASEWARNVALYLTLKSALDPVIGALQKILYATSSLATQLLPLILHEVLLSEIEGDQKTRQEASRIFQQALRDVNETTFPHVRLIINCILYLRHQELPHESTMDDRDGWLEIDYMEAAAAASQCRMYKTSLLFIEIHLSRIAAFSRRSSTAKFPGSLDLLHVIFKNIDDPDLFYGVEQDVSLKAVMGKLEHEGFGFKNLSFQSANYDADMKLARATEDTNAFGIIKALNTTNLQGIASTMCSALGGNRGSAEAFESMLSTALDLQQWDIPVPATSSATGNIFRALQSLTTLDDKIHLDGRIDECFLAVLDQLSEENQSLSSLRSSMTALGVLTEVDEVLSSQSFQQVQEGWERIIGRVSWLKFERYLLQITV